MLILNSALYAKEDHLDPAFPSSLVVPAGQSIEVLDGATAYGFVSRGTSILNVGTFQVGLRPGMYFCVPYPATIRGLDGFVCHRQNYRGLFQIGGPIEAIGRLRYIDGCSDTLIVSPPVKGDPCLNFLFVPPGTNQTPHTHPTVRVGLVMEGEGECRTTASTHRLSSRTIFVLLPNELHSFHTVHEHLRIVVYHPDSDFGPTDEDHPMLNRTLVENGPQTVDR